MSFETCDGIQNGYKVKGNTWSHLTIQEFYWATWALSFI